MACKAFLYVLTRPFSTLRRIQAQRDGHGWRICPTALAIRTKIGVAHSLPSKWRISGSVQCDEKLARWEMGS